MKFALLSLMGMCKCGSPPTVLPLQVRASLIVVYTHTGQTAEMVAKYRPPVPILTLVVPHLVVDNLKWKMEGR
jgi:pyruvate kinase